ncbi:hypothetical protein Cgig2_016391 [Carnegiea gigantea]|uniref:Uncharacterized protein n=1 Tax=Carnegiea gigantea TaxID=171969 RepID=A0A9Q1QFI2_9CARY|nr:hypothetical protein Cgig2_016391 [Carnegiea gigantea]
MDGAVGNHPLSGYKMGLSSTAFHTLCTSFTLTKGFPRWGFPRSLKTDEMALYVLKNFEWYRKEVAFPPLLLPSDYEDLYPDFDLAVAEEIARDFDVPEIPQVVFLAMLLNNTVKLGILCRSNILRLRHPEADNDQQEEEEEEDSGSGKASLFPSDDDNE